MTSLEGTGKEDINSFPLEIFQISVIRPRGGTHNFFAGCWIETILGTRVEGMKKVPGLVLKYRTSL